MPTVSRLVARIVAVGLALVGATCGDETPPAPPPITPAPHAVVPPAPRAAPARDPRLREDCGGWVPATDLLDEAALLGDATRRADALAALDAGPLARRIDVLRAGLRLADDAAALACAARLDGAWMDGWECARTIDLLVEDVLRPGTEADLDRLRDCLGSVDLARLVRASPPLPWAHDPEDAIGDLHEFARAPHAPAWFEWVARKEPVVADAAWDIYCKTMLLRSDAHRDLVATRLLKDDAGGTPTGPGLPPVLRSWLRDAAAWRAEDGADPWKPDAWDRRWLLAAVPAASDADLLCDAVEHQPSGPEGRLVAMLMLGRLRDERSAALLRKLATEDDEWEAWAALARRGDAAALDRIAEQAGDDGDSLSLLMELAPDRARTLIDDRLLGDDDAAAMATLSELEGFVQPGTLEGFDRYSRSFDRRRTSLAGLAEAAIAKPVPALRLGEMARIVPGCRTRAVAAAVARTLAPEDLVPDQDLDTPALWQDDLDSLAAFLETAAPDAFLVALRRAAAAGGAARESAFGYLRVLGDEEAAADYVVHLPDFAPSLTELSRMRGPAVRAELERRARREMAGNKESFDSAVAALAVFHGLPEGASYVLEGAPPAAAEAVLDGRPVDGLVVALEALLAAAKPPASSSRSDEVSAGDVGAVRDARVRDWLERLRARRELGAYWYATGQLAAMGDAAARAEHWKAVTDGRQRIVEDSSTFALTLGEDLTATVPHWIDELETNCCRAATAGRVLRGTIGIEETGWGGSGPRTDRDAAREIWDAAGGRFVRSRVLDRWVPAPH